MLSAQSYTGLGGLNESPYEKVGKSVNGQVVCGRSAASMKVPTKK